MQLGTCCRVSGMNLADAAGAEQCDVEHGERSD